ncbi:phosphomannomutase/phosphoglucomutase [Stenotrophomonas maltophilia]|uniref:phosphomannomutase/phosphoglucomutase n=1 Tax=Stenotrophomonas maltophilia TaxID=40324 RepID=UPI00066AA2D5|nr:phosphomannomutase/phosphoglucomutase [Stenotrophomonas maltophilia]ELK2667121.1 phosphomannomutase/phosphoglucomutase [Stenotrophomonas maltophilia]MBB5532335.1 phosphomannomutase/phosphoglucomutase [Stenotrophomonas maltophilia]MBH1377093.1 phosphomannomutase/phosphoglucomutase [Stenotrophomonas maltophilia]MBH1439902.1 phosphomannomutase/phosphoglucomutase [Stenotrophomonas maltophilia]MBH1560860.1 phosphomannomutase/phosphoglucomutase [Stenotrophomonas maltophilia]
MSGIGEGQRGRSLGRSAPLLGVLLVLLAGWFGWSAVQQWRQESNGQALEEARDQAVQGLQEAAAGQLKQLQQQLKNERVQQALQAGDAAAAALAVRESWTGVEQADVLTADLATAYADPATFGYARLALLEQALAEGKPGLRVVRDAGGNRLGLAAPVQLGSLGPAVLYVRQPLLRLTSPLDQVSAPSTGFLGLRQGTHDLVAQGDAGLAESAEALARPVPGTPLRLVAAVPNVEAGPLGLGSLASAIVALLLAFIAVLLVVGRGRLPKSLPLPRRAAVAEADHGPTLSESLQMAPPPVAAASAADTAPPPPPVPAGELAAGIFRAYDIRGVVGSELTPKTAALIGQAIGTVALEQGLREVVIGRDGRLSGPELAAGLAEGLRRTGCAVIDIGLAPTPVVYYAAFHLRTGTCVAVTGSHNPPEYNGFKVVIGGETLSGDAITDLYQRIVEGRLAQASEPGDYQQRDVSADYIQRIADDVQLDRPLKVVADAGNGVAGALAPQLLEAIGAEVIPLYCDVDGTFPNHHPDPSEPANLEDLVQTVKRFGADLGVAFDGDGDRLGVVTGEGRIIYADRLLMLFAADVLMRNPGAMVIYDVKCTGKLSDHVLRNGGSPLMWKTGHSLMKAKMRETDAELAGEMSGHFFFKERWFGFDDGLYAAARLLEILAQREETPDEVLAELPEMVATPELKVPVAEGTPHALVAMLVAAAQSPDNPYVGGRLSTIDGLRVDFPDGWGLVRASNTTPVLVLRFEGNDEAALERIQALFRSQLQPVLGDTPLGF